jgi:polysaccharide biosynthesis protein PslH
MSNRPSILFISRVAPSEYGIGVEQRAWYHVQSLAEFASVVVLIAMTEQRLRLTGAREPLVLPCAESALLPVKEDLISRPARIPGLRLLKELRRDALNDIKLEREALARACDLTSGADFDAAFCFRIRSFPIWSQLRTMCGARARKVFVDIDDIESKALLRAIPKERVSNGIEKSAILYLDAWRTARLERQILREADCSLVCSEDDRRVLRNRNRYACIESVPNVVSVPEMLPQRRPDGMVKLLMLGTMNYEPNADGAAYFCEKILPIIRKHSSRRVQTWIVGHHPPERVQRFGNDIDVFVTGGVSRVSPYYADADIAVVPIRHGGGTRIKILEAMAFGRPVVATSIGAEGIACINGEHILLADSPEQFARACLTLADSPETATRIAQNAHAMVARTYGIDSRRQALRKLVGA